MGWVAIHLTLGSVLTHFLIGHNLVLLFPAIDDLCSTKDPQIAFGVSWDPLLWDWQDPFLLGSSIGPNAFRAGWDPLLWVWQDPFVLGSTLGPIAFGADRDPLLLGWQDTFLLRSTFDPIAFGAGQDPISFGSGHGLAPFRAGQDPSSLWVWPRLGPSSLGWTQKWITTYALSLQNLRSPDLSSALRSKFCKDKSVDNTSKIYAFLKMSPKFFIFTVFSKQWSPYRVNSTSF